MKLPCDIINDLLPLYAEGLASEESKKAVEKHIETCPVCRKNLKAMGQPIHRADIEKIPLKKVKAKLQKQRFKAIVLAVVLVSVLAVSVTVYLTTPEYLPYSEGLFSVDEKEDGTIIVTVNKAISGYSVEGHFEPEDASIYAYHISVWKYRFGKKSTGQSILLNPVNAEKVAVFYYTDGEANTFIYGYNPYPDGGVITLPRLVLGYYVLLAMALIIILGLLLFAFRKQRRIKQVLEYLIAIPISYLIGHLCIKGFTTATYSATRDFFAIMIVAVLVYCAMLLILSLIKKKEV